jgi:hypothetical protein
MARRRSRSPMRNSRRASVSDMRPSGCVKPFRIFDSFRCERKRTLYPCHPQQGTGASAVVATAETKWLGLSSNTVERLSPNNRHRPHPRIKTMPAHQPLRSVRRGSGLWGGGCGCLPGSHGAPNQKLLSGEGGLEGRLILAVVEIADGIHYSAELFRVRQFRRRKPAFSQSATHS